MQAECLRSQIAPLAARCRSCSSNRQRTSAGVAPLAIRAKGRRLNAASVQTASARPRPSAWAVNSRPLAARYRSCSSNHQRTCAAQCLGSQIAPLAARYRSCSSNRQRTSAAQCLGSQFAPLAARYRSCSSRGQRTSAAQCLGSQIAPLAARCRSCSSSRQRTCAGVAPQAIRAKGRRLNAASVQTASARARRGLCMELSPSPHSIFYRARLRFL